MTKILTALLVLVAGALALVLVAARFDLFSGREPDDLGVRDGRLKPPSNTPNSVSSQAALYPDHPQRAYASIDAIALRGDATSTLAALRRIVEAMDGANIVEAREDYLRVRFRTRWMGFVDDTEFWFDPAAGAIQVRSAARVGRRDFGVNRDRIESIRRRLAAAG
jgi:uncharacterized protein (DUF1499 family)